MAVEFDGTRIDHRGAAHTAGAHDLRDALFDGGDELPGDGSTDDLVDELEALASIERLDPKERHAELPVAARLLLVLALGLGLGGDRLSEGDLHVLGHDL